ncbi:hypothetical protein K469DRAFT_694046 [Zopfia rhizophila CBS 207.26]|uniref:Uncharacterized protein n=1 Tax=Zopfia rhizophila CBS 207.26 TaxID=1314779 RepID=A0A6A6DN19_9PEZI|nr:hypothetical protein K469DRAFT_694046 [Zopfia rhizophila CBS 207.26]
MAPEKMPISNSKKKTALQKRPLKLIINDEDEHVNKLCNYYQVKEGNSKGNPIIIKDNEADSDLETEEKEAGIEAGACTKPLNLGDRNNGSDRGFPLPGEILQRTPPLQSRQELGTYMPANQEFSGTDKAESFNVPPVDRERAIKWKLDQLNRPEDVDYNSDASARDSKEDSQSLRPRKQRKPLALFKSSLLDSQLLHEGMNRNSGDDNHDINNDRIEDEQTEPTSFRDIRPSHDEVGDSGHNHSLNDLINESTEEEGEGGGVGGDDDDYESNNGDGNKDEDKKEDSSSSSKDNKDDSSHEGYEGHMYAERQRLFTSVRGNRASKRVAQLHAQQHRRSSSSVHESDWSTAHTSNPHKPLAHPKHSPRRA